MTDRALTISAARSTKESKHGKVSMGRGFTALSDGKTEASTSRRSEVPHTDAILRYEGSTVVYSASRRLHQFVVDGDMDISQNTTYDVKSPGVKINIRMGGRI